MIFAAVGIQRDVQFPPLLTALGTMLLLQPLAGAKDLRTGAIDEDMDGPFSWVAITLPLVRRSPFVCPTAQRRIVGNSEIQSHQAQHGR